MRILDILIEDKVKEKVLDKHNVRSSEIKKIMLDNPYVVKSGKNRYMAIGYYQRFLTIIFEMEESTAVIVTSYPSTDAQRKLYKLKISRQYSWKIK